MRQVPCTAWLCVSWGTAMTVAVLFARADSIYKALPDCDVWDAERDARRWPGGCPVVAHPPCRAWGRLRTFARPRPDEMNLARLAVALVREFGEAQRLPAPHHEGRTRAHAASARAMARRSGGEVQDAQRLN